MSPSLFSSQESVFLTRLLTTSCRCASQTPKSTPGHRPLMHFASPLFDTLPALIQFKSMLLDFFNGHELGEVHLAGLEHVISITAGPQPEAPQSSSSAVAPSEASTLPIIHFRSSTIRLLHSGTRIPRMELEPMGPNFDFRIRRRQEADDVVLKEAMRRPKLDKKNVEKGLGKKRKNIETDDMGDKVGKLHLGKQELGKLQYVLPSFSLPLSTPFSRGLTSRIPLTSPFCFSLVSQDAKDEGSAQGRKVGRGFGGSSVRHGGQQTRAQVGQEEQIVKPSLPTVAQSIMSPCLLSCHGLLGERASERKGSSIQTARASRPKSTRCSRAKPFERSPVSCPNSAP